MKSREELIEIIRANSSQNMTQDACDRQAERIADALIADQYRWNGKLPPEDARD